MTLFRGLEILKRVATPSLKTAAFKCFELLRELGLASLKALSCFETNLFYFQRLQIMVQTPKKPPWHFFEPPPRMLCVIWMPLSKVTKGYIKLSKREKERERQFVCVSMRWCVRSSACVYKQKWLQWVSGI